MFFGDGFLSPLIHKAFQDFAVPLSYNYKHDLDLYGKRDVKLQQYVNRELPDVQAGFRKGRGTRDCQYPATNIFGTKLPTSTGSSKKPDSSRKTSISALLTMPKPLTVWITTNCGKFFKRWKH